jgi:hypothetical protein
MMSCKDAVKLMSEGQERSLSPSERLGLRLHVFICRGCRATQRHFDFLRTAARKIGTPDS